MRHSEPQGRIGRMAFRTRRPNRGRYLEAAAGPDRIPVRIHALDPRVVPARRLVATYACQYRARPLGRVG
eukprot:477994-Rhodomonas_salina.2